MPYSQWCIHTLLAELLYIGALYISAWGFGVARFDLQGNFQEPQNVERATMQGFTLFLCLCAKGINEKHGLPES